MLQCNFCDFTTLNLQKHFNHRKLHGSLNSNFVCGFFGCQRQYQREVSMRVHYIKIHGLTANDIYRKNLGYGLRCNINGKYICAESSCQQTLNSSYDYIKHLKNHIQYDNLTITCPFSDCKKPKYNVVSSFTSHLSKCHRTVDTIQSASTLQREFSSAPGTLNQIDEFEITEDNIDCMNNEELKNLLLENLAVLFLRLENQFNVPASTVQFIVSQLMSLHELTNDETKTNLLPELIENGLSVEDSSTILNKILESNPFQFMHHFKTSFLRRKYYEKHFPYVDPIKVDINTDSGKFFYYVPIEKTLKKNLEYNFFYQNSFCNNHEKNENVLRDFTDGRVFQNNKFFHENPDGLKLILYQDSFETVNPIGSAKKKYKILAIYLTVGNLPHYLRSCVDLIQLVALCIETDFDHEKVYGKIVRDLQKIESEGIELKNGNRIKGALVFIAGDNLGSHALGGFTENFSKAPYCCRYCSMKKTEFFSKNGVLNIFEKRTKESYNQVVENIKLNSQGGEQILFNSKGIKFDSAFNRLKYYHVIDGLPPCLAHDIFECLIMYDVKIFLDHLLQKKRWLAPSKTPYSLLNSRIDAFPYSSEDRRDKPCTISRRKMKITGGAWQLWTFLRLLPLIIIDKIKDSNEDSWRAILILTEIIEIVIAPEIHKCFLPHLELLIAEYIAIRQQFPFPLRPKHHFLQHYPELILLYGPLIKVWTLRFESKHGFFKKYIRSSRNFINVTKSLSKSHEKFQCIVRMRGNNRKTVEIGHGSNFDVNNYSTEIKNAVMAACLSQSVQEFDKITINGEFYKKGDAVFISSTYCYDVEVGKIINILYDENSENGYAIVEVLETIFEPHLRAYMLKNKIRNQCIKFSDLPSKEKLHIYNNNYSDFVKPCFGLVRHGV